MQFRKITAAEPIFQMTKEKHKDTLLLLEEYAQYLSMMAGRGNAKKSGKGRSYAFYIVRLVILYEENFPTAIHDLLSYDALWKLEKVTNDPMFASYNRQENHFPSASFTCFTSFLNHYITAIDDIGDLYAAENPATPNDGFLLKEDQVHYRNFSIYPRSIAESLEAKKRSNWLCEADTSHKTFISNINKQFYVEAHHLVPMAAQHDFTYTLDFADNIVCLCPNCHRKIHHAIDLDKKKMIGTFYEQREERLVKRGVDVGYERLLRYYGVL